MSISERLFHQNKPRCASFSVLNKYSTIHWCIFIFYNTLMYTLITSKLADPEVDVLSGFHCIEDVMLWPGMRFSLRSQCKRCSAGRLHNSLPYGSRSAIRDQRDEAYVSKIVCYLHVMASNPHPPLWRAPHLHHFYFTSSQPIRPKEASDSDFTIEDVMLWPGMRFSSERCSAGRLQSPSCPLQLSIFSI